MVKGEKRACLTLKAGKNKLIDYIAKMRDFKRIYEETKEKSEVRLNLRFWVATKKLIERPLSNLWSVLHIFWGVTAKKLGCQLFRGV